MKTKLNDIKINPDRQRQHFDEDEIAKLADSFRLIGQIQPIVIDEDMTLVAGECRIRAARLIGWTELETILRDDLNELEKELVELEENIRRQDLHYKDELAATKKLHLLYQKIHGKPVQHSANPKGWKITDTAKHIGLSMGAISEDIQLAKAIEKNPSLGDLPTKSAAKSAFRRQQNINSRRLLAALSSDKEKKITTSTSTWLTRNFANDTITLYNASAHEIIPTLADKSIDCLITDPPWQVQFDERFGSDSTTGLKITSEVLKLLHPKLHEGSLCWMFCASKHLFRGTIYNLINDAGYNIFEQFGVWYKKHIAASSRPFNELKNDFEPFMVFTKGTPRDLTKPMYAVQEYKVHGTRVHDAQKPFDLLEFFINQSTVEDELVIDPFCGSGQTGRAIKNTKRKGILIEKEKQWFDVACTEIVK